MISVPKNAIQIVPDGGIIKMMITESDDKKSISWDRGTNALFHYTVHAYVAPKEEQASVQSQNNCDHSHAHHSGCSHHKPQLENMKNILEAISAKKPIPKELLGTDTKETQLDPNLKPVRNKVSDSRELDPSKPFELRIGYGFSVKALELCVKSMQLGEKARFLCMPSYCDGFIQLETVLRQNKVNRQRAEKGLSPINFSGCCNNVTPEMLDIQTDLESINGAPLEFEIELLKIQEPNSYTREAWEMEPVEKYNEIPKLKELGSQLFRKGDIKGAQEYYEKALAMIQSLNSNSIILDLKKDKMDRERDLKRNVKSTELPLVPDDNIIKLEVIEELTKLCKLNRAACLWKNADYKGVITECSEVLKKDPKCVKALFRRGQSYLKLGRDLDLAEKDFKALDGLLDSQDPEREFLEKEKKSLAYKLKEYAQKEKQMYGKMFE